MVVFKTLISEGGAATPKIANAVGISFYALYNNILPQALSSNIIF